MSQRIHKLFPSLYIGSCVDVSLENVVDLANVVVPKYSSYLQRPIYAKCEKRLFVTCDNFTGSLSYMDVMLYTIKT